MNIIRLEAPAESADGTLAAAQGHVPGHGASPGRPLRISALLLRQRVAARAALRLDWHHGGAAMSPVMTSLQQLSASGKHKVRG